MVSTPDSDKRSEIDGSATGSIQWRTLQARLPELITLLSGRGFDAGPDQYLNASDLLVLEAAAAREPVEGRLQAMLASIFCTSAEQQAVFPAVFTQWFHGSAEKKQERVDETSRFELWRARWQRYWWLPVALIVFALAVWLIPPADQSSGTVDGVIDGAPSGQGTNLTQENPTTQNTSVLPPRPVPDNVRLPPSYLPKRTHWLRWLWLLPLFLFSGYGLNVLFRRHRVASHRKSSEQDHQLSSLRLAAADRTLFNDTQLESTWRQFRQRRTEQSLRIDEGQTVDRWIRSGGFFDPVYRKRSVPPAYLALVDQWHAEDHTAGLADEWLNRLERENVVIQRAYYQGDPRYLSTGARASGQRHSVGWLSMHWNRDLLVLGDGAALAKTQEHEPLRWVAQLRRFHRTWLLSPRPLWPLARLYQHLLPEIASAPLTIAGLHQLGEDTKTLTEDEPGDLPVPILFSEEPDAWLQNYRRSRAEWRVALQTLRQYLGAEGYLLLCATASYPRLYWQLTRVLDHMLFDAEAERLLRLRKLARLPWFRYGFMPLGLRKRLLRSLDKPALSRIAQILDQAQRRDSRQAVYLPIYVPESEQRGAGVEFDATIDAAAGGEALADPVYANVIRGRKPGLVEMPLLASGNRELLQGNPSVLLWLVLGWLIVLWSSLWANAQVWENWAVHTVRSNAVAQLQQDNQAVNVTVQHLPRLAAHARSLATALQNYGYVKVIVLELPDPDERQQDIVIAPRASASENELQNTLRYNLTDELLDTLRYPVWYQLYGEIDAIESQDVASNSAEITLQAEPIFFQDAFDRGEPTVAPEMVRIDGGCFQMGSPVDEPTRDGDERLHEVCVEPFWLSATEVTFAQYDIFATATGRQLPGDEDWGRESRPVINVSWDDATAYANWLSNQTVESYRLPTEAEWEYAARAGSDTPFYTGDCIDGSLAVFDTTIGYSECPMGKLESDRTESVRSREPNAWGLYDMAGNVWEWTCSAYAVDYSGGEKRCAATDEATARVLRGGSWSDFPFWLRSASRYNYVPDVYFDDVGIRLARAVP